MRPPSPSHPQPSESPPVTAALDSNVETPETTAPTGRSRVVISPRQAGPRLLIPDQSSQIQVSLLRDLLHPPIQ